MKLPAPNAYNPKHLEKIINVPLSSVEKGTTVLHSMWRGQQTPGAKYIIEPGEIATRPKVRVARMLMTDDEKAK